MKKFISFFIAFSLVFTLTACSGGKQNNNADETNNEIKSEQSYQPQSSALFTFHSGAGAWGTTLKLNADGTFTGEFNDSDMGERNEDYPGGIRYYCSFSGKFEDIQKVDEYSYKMTLADFKAKEEPGKEYIEDGVKYILSEPYGLEEGKDFILYLPDTPIDNLSKEFLSWWPYRAEENGKETLSCYGILNVSKGYGFFYQQNDTNTDKYIIQTPFYQIYEEDLQKYKYKITSGKYVLVDAIKTGTAPQIDDKGDGILRLFLGSGTNAFSVKYFNVYNKTVSEEFNPCSIYADYINTKTKEYYIAYFKLEEKPKLYINGFFDSSEFSTELDLDFSMATCEKIIFLNEEEIYLEYIDTNLENIKKVVNYKN